MEIYADFRQKVSICPKDVIKKLIKSEVGEGWIFEKDNKFYLGYESGLGSHSFDVEVEISEEKYQYIIALNTVLKKLSQTV